MALLALGLSLDLQSHQSKEQKSELSKGEWGCSYLHLLGRFQLLFLPIGGFFRRAEFPGHGHDLQGAGYLLWGLI